MINNYSLPRQMVFDEVTEKYKLPIKNVELLINLVRHEQAENESSQNAKRGELWTQIGRKKTKFEHVLLPNK